MRGSCVLRAGSSVGVIFLFLILSARAQEPVAPAGNTDDKLNSASWWREQAAQYGAAIEDANARSDTHYELAFECGHAGELDSAEASAKEVAPSTKAIYALTFVAKKYHEAANADAAAALMREAQRIAQLPVRRAENFGNSHLIRAFIELQMEQEARAYIASISDPVQQRLASRALLSAMAKSDLINLDNAQLSQDEWSEVAYAFASEGRVDETLAVTNRLTDPKQRDRAFIALMRTLVERKRWEEAQPVAERITSKESKADANGQILTEWAKQQSADAVAARLEQVNTQDEKFGLYNQLIEKLADEDRLDEAEAAIEQLVELIQRNPQPAEISAFGQFNDAVRIATAKSHYTFVAKALAKRGDRAAAEARIKLAAEPIIALDRSAGLAKMMLVMKLIDAQITIDDLKAARRTLEQLGDPGSFAMPLMRLAQAYVKAGNSEAAMETARLADKNRTGRDNVYGRTAAELIAAGDLPAAKQLLAELEPTADNAQAFRGAAAAMIRRGDAAGLQKWINDMPNALQKAFACIGAAEALRKANSP